MKRSLLRGRFFGQRKVAVAIFNGTHEANDKLQKSQEGLGVRKFARESLAEPETNSQTEGLYYWLPIGALRV
jgi:hypothetical protein